MGIAKDRAFHTEEIRKIYEKTGNLMGKAEESTGSLRTQSDSLQTLLDRTGESAQIYRRQGDQRVCIAAVERTSGLRDSIPVGAMLSMEAGSAAQILLAWEDSDRLHQGLRHAKFTATKLAAVRKRGWSESVNEREEGVCSISAPIRNASGQVIAAISISGPTGRMGAAPGRRYAPLVMAAGKYLTEALVKAVR